MVSHLVYSDCTFEDQDEGSAQAPRFPSFVKNCPASAHFWALAYISSSWGKVACFTKALSPSIVYLMSCVLDFVWKRQISRLSIVITKA